MKPSTRRSIKQDDAHKQRQTDEVERLRSDPCPRGIPHVVPDDATQVARERRHFLGAADFGVVDHAADVGSLCHQGHGHEGKQEDRAVQAGRQGRSPPELPQRQPGEGTGQLHEAEREKRRTLVRLDKRKRHHAFRCAVADLASVLQEHLSRVAGRVGRNRHEGDKDKDDEAGLLEVLAARAEREDEERDTHAEPDGRHVVEQKVKMCRIHRLICYGRRRMASMLSRGEVRGLDRINVDTGSADRRASLLPIRQKVHTALLLESLVSVMSATPAPGGSGGVFGLTPRWVLPTQARSSVIFRARTSHSSRTP